MLIVNTHLYASHLASGSMLLPAHEFVVFDEAHEVLDIFASLLGTSLNATTAARASPASLAPCSARPFAERCARPRDGGGPLGDALAAPVRPRTS